MVLVDYEKIFIMNTKKISYPMYYTQATTKIDICFLSSLQHKIIIFFKMSKKF